MYRNIIELSNMTNNDEYVIYTEEELKIGDELPIKSNHILLGEPRLRISRLVLPEEVNAGLDISFEGDRWDEKVGEPTLILDSLYRLLKLIEDTQELNKLRKKPMTPSQILADEISNEFYDCMTGGANTHDLIVWKHVCNKWKLDLTTEIYPRKCSDDGSEVLEWDTLEDFLKESVVEKLPGLEDVLRKYQMKLPENTKRLLLSPVSEK